MFTISRRRLLKQAGFYALAAAAYPGFAVKSLATGQSIPWTSGTQSPKMKMPAHATDCHFHIYDKSFPRLPNTLAPADATLADYRALQKRLGTERCVLVLPSTYGTNNEVYFGLLKQLGKENARMVGVFDDTVSDKGLEKMHNAGVRGVRFNLSQPGLLNVGMIEPLSHRLNELGWHFQLNMLGKDLVANSDLFLKLNCKFVLDHLGRVPQPEGLNSDAWRLISKMIDKGNTWVKSSGYELDSKVGAPSYSDSMSLLKAYTKRAPERILWASNWPHPQAQASLIFPDDAHYVDLFNDAMPDETTRVKILVKNPAELYGF